MVMLPENVLNYIKRSKQGLNTWLLINILEKNALTAPCVSFANWKKIICCLL